MKTPKSQKESKNSSFDNTDKIKGKKKMSPQSGKINVKSTKFWNERYDTEGEDLEKYIH